MKVAGTLLLISLTACSNTNFGGDAGQRGSSSDMTDRDASDNELASRKAKNTDGSSQKESDNEGGDSSADLSNSDTIGDSDDIANSADLTVDEVNVCRKKNKGRVVVANDEWPMSDTGFANSPDSAVFIENVAHWLGGCEARPQGKFHAYSNDFSLTEPALATHLKKLGHSWTVGTDISLSVDNLLKYDWILLSGPIPPNPAATEIFTEYVKKGGGLYIAAGTGKFPGSYAGEAVVWNSILKTFGLQYAQTNNDIKKVVPIASNHPIFDGVSGLYQNNGNSISLYGSETSKTKVLVNQGGQGMYAVYDGSL